MVLSSESDEQKDRSSENRLSFWGLVFAIMVTALGTPVLTLPSTAREVGPWPAVFLLFFTAVLNSESARLVAGACGLLEKMETSSIHGTKDHDDAQIGGAEPLTASAGVDGHLREDSATSVAQERNEVGERKSQLHHQPAFVSNYAAFVNFCFRDQPVVRGIATGATFFGYFTMQICGDIVLGNALLQLVPQLQSELRLSEFAARAFWSVAFLLPLHFFQAFCSADVREFTTKQLAGLVPYAFGMITLIILVELHTQEVNEHSRILDFYSTSTTTNPSSTAALNAADEQRNESDISKNPPKAKERLFLSSPKTSSTRQEHEASPEITPTEIEIQSGISPPSPTAAFAAAWHTWRFHPFGNVDGVLTFLRVGAVQSYAFMAASLIPTLRGRCRPAVRAQISTAYYSAMLIVATVFSCILLYSYRVCGNSIPDVVSNAFRRDRPDKWWLMVFGFSTDAAQRAAATDPAQCFGVRTELTPLQLFRGAWPQNKAAPGGGPEYYAPWSMGDPTWVSRGLNLLVLFCMSTCDLLYVTNFFTSSEEQCHCLRTSRWANAGFRISTICGRVLCSLVVPYIVEIAGLVTSLSLALTELIIPLYAYYKLRSAGAHDREAPDSGEQSTEKTGTANDEAETLDRRPSAKDDDDDPDSSPRSGGDRSKNLVADTSDAKRREDTTVRLILPDFKVTTGLGRNDDGLKTTNHSGSSFANAPLAEDCRPLLHADDYAARTEHAPLHEKVESKTHEGRGKHLRAGTKRRRETTCSACFRSCSRSVFHSVVFLFGGMLFVFASIAGMKRISTRIAEDYNSGSGVICNGPVDLEVEVH
ncbi:unnamed protein product [Amoebophrya sp. A120]|nr:unnamed protein product [Amoebophrya sp. A120]|eukprot:GSA120T00019080001.1